jgi:uncharacterized protein (DUF1015 family)
MEVRPFKALRFNREVVGDVGRCIAPPYDVIDAAQQDELYRKSKYNIVRITRGKTTRDDDGQDNPYTRAAAALQEWMAEGALKADADDTIYGYAQDFEINGTAFQRLSFIALGKLEEFGRTVKPHEQVFQKPMLDRLNLKKATAARFGLVFMLYDDPDGTAETVVRKAVEREPLVDFTDEQNVRHRLYAITDPDDIRLISRMMADKSCIIADGHHRYTTGLTYYRETGNPAAKYQMLAFTNMHQDGLVVLATHRLVGGLDGFDPEAFLTQLRGKFDVVPFRFAPDAESKSKAKEQMLAGMRDLHDKGESAIGIYMGAGAFYVSIIRDGQLMAAAAPDKSEAWRGLDVSVLQKLVLEELLHIDEERMGDPDCVAYVKDRPNAVNELIAHVDDGDRQIAFFTNPVRMQQLAAVTDAGERMPHKSTYFYPKMYTGLTIQKL